MISVQERKKILVGDFELEPEKRLLTRDGQTVHLAHRPFQVLLYLIENRDRMVSRTELLDKFWDGHDVYEATLSKCVGAVRKALGDKPDEPRFIETRWAEGYRYIGEYTEIEVGTPQENGDAVATIDKKFELAQAGNTKSKLEENASGHQSVQKTPRRIFATAALISVIFLTVAAIWFLRPSAASQNKLDSIHSIAVMPLKNLTGDGEQEYIVDGMTESLIAALSRIDGMKVISRGSIAGYKDQEVEPQEIAKRLGVESILEGSMKRNGDRFRVEIRIVSTQDGSILWSGDTYERLAQNVVTLEDEIAGVVVNKLRGGQTVVRRQTESNEAHELYLKGRYFWNRRAPDALIKAIEQFNKAKDVDPNYALAYSGLADCYVLLAEYRVMPADEAFPKGKEAAEKALQLDPSSAEAHTALAYVLGFYDWNFPDADRAFQDAIAQNPNYVTARQWYAEYLQTKGNFDEAYAELRRAEEIDPLSLIVKTDLAEHYYFTRQYDKAIEQSKSIIEIDPNFAWGYGFLWLSYKEKGMYKEATEASIKGEVLTGLSEEMGDARRAAFNTRGWHAFWLKWVEQNEGPKENRRWQAIDYAAVYIMLGDHDRAISFLQKSFEKHERWFLYTRYAPMFDDLRSDSRFTQLLDRTQLN